MKSSLICPGWKVMTDGTRTTVLLLLSAIVAGVVNADEFRASLQARIPPAVTGLGVQTSDVGSTGRNKIPWLTVPPKADAVMIADSAVLIDGASAVKLAVVAPPTS